MSLPEITLKTLQHTKDKNIAKNYQLLNLGIAYVGIHCATVCI